MPIQEYIYNSDDEQSRQRAIEDAANIGSLAQFFHDEGTKLNFIEAGNKTGSADVYERLCERCNNEISKLVLGNTLTTESSSNGTQALGTVHKKVEDKVAEADKRYLLDVLNYDMADIFSHMGIDTSGGVFCFPEKKEIDPASKVNILTQIDALSQSPISDDYLYEEFGIEKPADYERQKREREEERKREDAAAKQLQQTQQKPAEEEIEEPGSEPEPKPKPEPVRKKSFRDRLARFFGKAPSDGGAVLDW